MNKFLTKLSLGLLTGITIWVICAVLHLVPLYGDTNSVLVFNIFLLVGVMIIELIWTEK